MLENRTASRDHAASERPDRHAHGGQAGSSQARRDGGDRQRSIAQTLSHAAGFNLRRSALHHLLPAMLVLGLMALMWDKIEQLDLAYIRSSLKAVAPWQWLAASGFTAVSFWMLGQYDRVVHRLLTTSATREQAALAGMAAIGISQTVGLGVISATLVRWRMLPDSDLTQAARISVIVSASFLSSWAVITAVVVIMAPVAQPWGTWVQGAAWLVLSAATAGVIASVVRPGLLPGLSLPPLRAVAAFLCLATLDMAAAGAALWVVLPADCDISAVVLIATYMLALGAGLLSGTPGGMGAFELTLLGALPEIGHEPLLAAVLAFRTVYFAVPAALAALISIRGPRDALGRGKAHLGPSLRNLPTPHLPTSVAQALSATPRAETGLLRHGRLSLIQTDAGDPMAMGAVSGQSLIVVSDPIGPINPKRALDTALSDIKALANVGFHTPFLYKVGGRTACVARRAGWQVLPIAREALLDPQRFTLDGSDKRQLRRKLRQAEQAGVSVRQGAADLPLSAMEDIADRWAKSHGGERGFSMGVWAPDTLPFARVFLAWHDGRLVGFLTLHENSNEYALDLMRLADTAPDGTMHALVVAALSAAKDSGIGRLSLAAVPLGPRPHEAPIFRHVRRALDAASGADGLRQFKSAFAPTWETLYAAAPSGAALMLGTMDVMREIHRSRTN